MALVFQADAFASGRQRLKSMLRQRAGSGLPCRFPGLRVLIHQVELALVSGRCRPGWAAIGLPASILGQFARLLDLFPFLLVYLGQGRRSPDRGNRGGWMG